MAVAYQPNNVTANISEPAGESRTATSSSSVTSQQPHRSHIIVHIYARTKAATDAVVGDIEKVISEYLMDKVLDQSQDQAHIAKLTEHQVML